MSTNGFECSYLIGIIKLLESRWAEIRLRFLLICSSIIMNPPGYQQKLARVFRYIEDLLALNDGKVLLS